MDGNFKDQDSLKASLWLNFFPDLTCFSCFSIEDLSEVVSLKTILLEKRQKSTTTLKKKEEERGKGESSLSLVLPCFVLGKLKCLLKCQTYCWIRCDEWSGCSSFGGEKSRLLKYRYDGVTSQHMCSRQNMYVGCTAVRMADNRMNLFVSDKQLGLHLSDM